MAIVESKIKNSIKKMMEEISKTEADQETAIDLVASQWAKIIADAIKSADVTGVLTTVAGTSPSGPVTGIGTQSNNGKLI